MSHIIQHLFDVHSSALVRIELAKEHLHVEVCQCLGRDGQIAAKASLQLLEVQLVRSEDQVPGDVPLRLRLDDQAARACNHLLWITDHRSTVISQILLLLRIVWHHFSRDWPWHVLPDPLVQFGWALAKVLCR